MSKQDIIISSASGYSWDQLQYWAKSISKSGFEGETYLVLYDQDPEIIKNMENHGIQLFFPISNHLGGKELDVVTDRFYQKWVLINSIGHERIHRVISTDVQDVVFQTDPTAWLDEHLGDYQLFVTSEGIAYEHEGWGRKNFMNCFGEAIWNSGVAHRTILNCGVWGGSSRLAADLFLLIYLIGFGHPMHSIGQRPSARWTDQAALNLVSSMDLVKDKIRFIKSEEGFAAQLGTFLALDTSFGKYLNEPVPVVENGEVFTSSGSKFVVVHQYNRIPELARQIRERLCN